MRYPTRKPNALPPKTKTIQSFLTAVMLEREIR